MFNKYFYARRASAAACFKVAMSDESGDLSSDSKIISEGAAKLARPDVVRRLRITNGVPLPGLLKQHPAFVKTVSSFKINQLNVPDEFWSAATCRRFKSADMSAHSQIRKLSVRLRGAHWIAITKKSIQRFLAPLGMTSDAKRSLLDDDCGRRSE